MSSPNVERDSDFADTEYLSVGRHFSGRMTTSVTPQVLPPPRGLDPRYVTWRGGVVWTRLDAMNDIWIKRQEWDEIGMKAYRNRLY